jgi:hypothetical protein
METSRSIEMTAFQMLRQSPPDAWRFSTKLFDKYAIEPPEEANRAGKLKGNCCGSRPAITRNPSISWTNSQEQMEFASDQPQQQPDEKEEAGDFTAMVFAWTMKSWKR